MYLSSIEVETLNKLEELQMVGEADFVVRLIDLFSESAPSTISTLCQAASAGDMNVIEKTSHRLKSSAAHIGARKLADICAEIESCARQGSTEGQIARLDNLISEFEKVKQELAAIKSSRS